MKNIVIYLSLIIVLTGAGACSLLDIDPQENIPDKGVIVDEKSAEKALIGVYEGTKAFEGLAVVSWNNAADNIVAFSRQSVIIPTLQAAGSSAFDPTSAGGYSTYYAAINRANSVIKYASELDSSLFKSGSKERILGEAYFLRALAYFDLSRTYGGVPIVLEPSTDAGIQNGIKKSTTNKTLEQVLSDLDAAEGLLEGTLNDRSRASIWSVYALKARLYLYTEEWDLAEQYAGYVIDNPSIVLTEEISDFFTNRLSSESIFEMVSSSSDTNPYYTYYLMPAEGGRLDYIPNPSLIASFLDPGIGGKRSQLIKQRESDGVYVVREYDKQDGSSSIFVLRLAEQYLIRAEARIRKAIPDRNGAVEDINTIKERAQVPLLSVPTTLNIDDLELIIEEERQLELAFEGHRYSDIIRTGRASEVFGQYNSDYKDSRYWVFPFPYTAIAADPDLEQNDGYKSL